MKVLKIILGIIVALILIFIIAAILLVTFVNPNDYKDKISQAVMQNTGRHLAIKGNLGWTFFPWLGIEAKDVTLSNPPGFINKPFIQAGTIDFNVKLFPLITGKVEIGKIYLTNLSINLIKNKTGRVNWAFATTTKPKTVTNKSIKSKDKKSTTGKDLDLTISKVKISNANVTWNNQQSGQTAKLSNLNFMSNKIRYTSTATQTSVNPLASLRMTGKLSIAKVTSGRWLISKINAKISAKNSIINLSPITAQLYQGNSRGKVVINAQKKINHYTIQEQLSNVQLSGLANSKRIGGTANIQLNATARGTSKPVSTLNGTAKISAVNGELKGVNIPILINQAVALIKKKIVTKPSTETDSTKFGSLTGTATIRNGIVSNKDLRLEGPNLNADGSGTVNLVTDNLNYRLNVKVKGITKVSSIPILITGTLSNPKYRLSMQGIVPGLILPQIEKPLEKTLKGVGEKLKKLF